MTPTNLNYSALDLAYDFFNRHLFQGRLPTCLLTMQRTRAAYGFFAGRRFAKIEDATATDEIAMNPVYFQGRSVADCMSTLVHEMTHLEQAHFGKPSKGGYHNRAWAELMLRVGLVPSHNGQPGGKQTGPKMTHYIEAGGPFDRACARLIGTGFSLPYVDVWGDEETRKKKAASKTKYTCPDCCTNAWAKPDTRLICGDCHEIMEA